MKYLSRINPFALGATDSYHIQKVCDKVCCIVPVIITNEGTLSQASRRLKGLLKTILTILARQGVPTYQIS